MLGCMRNVIILLIFFVSLPLFARDVYKWTNAEGVVFYSDTYREGAERIRVQDSKSSSSRPGKEGGEGESAEQAAGTEAATYESLEIVQPANDATVRSNEGTVAVGLALSPGLAEGHSVKVLIDGNEMPGEVKGTQFSVSNLNRGTHSLETRVVDADGNVMITSNRINFHLRQASVNTP